MGQSVYNLCRPLCDFLWDLPAVGYRAGQKPHKQAPHVIELWLQLQGFHDSLSRCIYTLKHTHKQIENNKISL